MAKGKKQTAEDLLKRYSDETISLRLATSPVTEPKKKTSPLLESLRRNVNRVVMIPIDLLVIEENVRRQVDETSPEFTSLVDSISESGIRQNIIVDLQDEDDENYKLVVVAGQRRTLAGRKAGVQQVAALVVRMSGRGERLIEGLAENLLREDLHCLDQADAYAALIEEGWTQEEIAHKFERRRRTILQFLRLARYPQRAKDLIRANRELFTTNLLFNKFIAKNWKSEEELLQAVREVIGNRPKLQPAAPVTTPTDLSTNLTRLIALVNRYNGLGCKAKGTDESGKIVITYKSKSALEKILSLFEED
ncbi:MAG TPA: ParB/RepB/Spo0J family partition protein [Blastocatellia bacterium]|nr:ParB/RepB/Spo0J family partition protein [Blastocatellia bacterium]